MQAGSRHIAVHIWRMMFLWTGAIGLLFFSDCWHLGKTIEEIALVEARAYLNKDQAIRRWAASHGGVYVPVSEKTPPNPFLKQVPERDIHTPGGQWLTLMNPAYMIRQVMTDYDRQYHVRGHITSLKYFREETAPDAWERKALAAFEKGCREFREFTEIRGESHLRIMKPLIAEAQCLKCHASQGYKVGDIRGGVSLALPMRLFSDYRRSEIAAHGISFGALWLLGSAGILLAGTKLSHYMKQREEAKEELKASEEQLKRLVARLIQRQEVERKSVALEMHEDIAQSLSAVKLNLEASLCRQAESPSPESEFMRPIIERIKETIDLIRRLTKRLSPIMLDDLGIKTAVSALCRDIMKTSRGSEIITRIDIDERLIPGELKIVIYRVLEELLTLSSGHCREDRWTVALEEYEGHIALIVQEMGLPVRQLAENPGWDMGMAMVKNRVESSAGSLSIESVEESRTRITVQWPLTEMPA